MIPSKSNLKKDLYRLCEDFIERRFNVVKNSIEGIHESLLSETKSSAGDKHETGRAMLQLEREKAGKQLAEIQKSKTVLTRIDIEKPCAIVGLGSVVITSKSNYFIAISAGELKYDGDTFYAISPYTPIAKLLLSKKVGDEIIFRNHNFTITKIV